MNAESLVDYPILTEELDLIEGFRLQRRMNSSGSRGVLTIAMGRLVVFAGVLDSPTADLTGCIGTIKRSLQDGEVDPDGGCDDIGIVRTACEGAVATLNDEVDALTSVRAAVRGGLSAAAVADARSRIEQSRAKIQRQRAVLAHTERQIARCEESIVLSRLAAGIRDEDSGDQMKPAPDSDRELFQDLLEKRLAVREEKRALREAEVAIQESVGALPER